MAKEIQVGIKGENSVTVTRENTAEALGSGLLPVFSTPSLIALMENTCSDSMLPYMEDGFGTVGISLDVKHTAATPIGMTVRCESELVEIDRRRLVFTVRAYDDAGEVGYGTHERFIIENEKFMSKVNAKLGK